MEQSNVIPMTPQLAKVLQARRLIVEHAPAGLSNWMHWELHREYLELPMAQRPKTFSEYVIQELSK